MYCSRKKPGETKMNEAYKNKDLWFNVHVDFISNNKITNNSGVKLIGPYISKHGAEVDSQTGKVNMIMIKKEDLKIK